MSRPDPYRNYRFIIVMDGRPIAGVSKVKIRTSGGKVAHGKTRGSTRKLPGIRKSTNLTLKRGLTTSAALFNWFRAVVTGDRTLRKKLKIVGKRQDGTAVVQWVLSNAWPIKFTGSNFDAKASEVAIDTLELTGEGIERVP
jgi:phage tail-like protein